MGRPTKYKAEYAIQAGKLCALGATDVQLADFFDVSEPTINAWKSKHPAFLKSLSESKALSDDKVERALYEKAIGYTVTETRTTETEHGPIVSTLVKELAPDTGACFIWLKNRRPADWTDQRTVNVEVLTDEDRMDRIDLLLRSVLDRDAKELLKH